MHRRAQVQRVSERAESVTSWSASALDHYTDKPNIILCDNAFNKKANGHVGYLINTPGATLLHEYFHFDGLVESVFGAPIIDQLDPNDNPIGYGPVQVYDNLSKDLAPYNADSYTYYALHKLWHVLCQKDFAAPRAGTDDDDTDCGGQACAE